MQSQRNSDRSTVKESQCNFIRATLVKVPKPTGIVQYDRSSIGTKCRKMGHLRPADCRREGIQYDKIFALVLAPCFLLASCFGRRRSLSCRVACSSSIPHHRHCRRRHTGGRVGACHIAGSHYWRRTAELRCLCLRAQHDVPRWHPLSVMHDRHPLSVMHDRHPCADPRYWPLFPFKFFIHYVSIFVTTYRIFHSMSF